MDTRFLMFSLIEYFTCIKNIEIDYEWKHFMPNFCSLTLSTLALLFSYWRLITSIPDESWCLLELVTVSTNCSNGWLTFIVCGSDRVQLWMITDRKAAAEVTSVIVKINPSYGWGLTWSISVLVLCSIPGSGL